MHVNKLSAIFHARVRKNKFSYVRGNTIGPILIYRSFVTALLMNRNIGLNRTTGLSFRRYAIARLCRAQNRPKLEFTFFDRVTITTE